MTKNEFLSVLRGQITGRIPTKEVESQVDYYSSYIDGKVASGLSEAQVIEELGDPRLISKMIIESTERIAEAAGYDGAYKSSTDTYEDSDGINSGIFGNSTGSRSYQQSTTYEGGAFRGGEGRTDQKKSVFSSGKTGCIIAAVVLLIVIAAIFAVIYFVFNVTFRIFGWLIPAIAVTIVIGVIISIAGRR